MTIEEWGVPDLSEVAPPLPSTDELKHETFTAKLLPANPDVSGSTDALLVEFANGIVLKLEQRNHLAVNISTYGASVALTNSEKLAGARDGRIAFIGDGLFLSLQRK